MDKNIYKELKETSADMLKTISSFTREQFNVVPFEGSWTAGQVSEHLLMANSGAVERVSGNAKPTERDPAENEKKLREIFLDFGIKMKSPEFLLPSDKPEDKTSTLNKFEDVMDKLNVFSEKEDLSLTCMDFEMPGIGFMTRYEWVCFVICHSKRHTHQMKEIHNKLGK